MNHLVGYYLPSLFGLKIFLYFNKEVDFDKKDKIFYYLMFLMFSNTISVAISRVVMGLSTKLETSLSELPMFSVKYIFISIIVNFILAIIITIIKNELSISLDVIRDEKKKKNKTGK